MSAIVTSVGPEVSQNANAWFEQHHKELNSRAWANCHRYPPDEREEAVAEILAAAFGAVVRAARRGVLGRVTPYWLVIYGTRQFNAGRRFAGTWSRCALSTAAKRRHGARVVSLDQEIDPEAPRTLSLGDTLADGDAENPFDVARRNHDYPAILEMEALRHKALATLRFLAETMGDGKQLDLANELRISPGRATQLKHQLRNALGRHGYAGPLEPRPSP